MRKVKGKSAVILLVTSSNDMQGSRAKCKLACSALSASSYVQWVLSFERVLELAAVGVSSPNQEFAQLHSIEISASQQGRPYLLKCPTLMQTKACSHR